MGLSTVCGQQSAILHIWSVTDCATRVRKHGTDCAGLDRGVFPFRLYHALPIVYTELVAVPGPLAVPCLVCDRAKVLMSRLVWIVYT